MNTDYEFMKANMIHASTRCKLICQICFEDIDYPPKKMYENKNKDRMEKDIAEFYRPHFNTHALYSITKCS